MPGLADIIGLGAEGAVNPNFGAQLHQQKFEASQQLQRLQHMHRQELAQNAQQNAEYYGGVGSPTGRQLHTLSQELLSYPNDATLESNLAKAQARYSQLVAAGDKELAQSHDGNRPIAPVGAAPAPPNAMNSSPFSPFIGQGAKEAFPIGGAPPAAQPATNPLTSPASGTNGGPASGQAGFPGPTASGPAPAPSVPAIPAVGSDAGIPAAPVAPVAGPAPALPNFQGDIDEFNQTGYMSPAIRAMIPGNAALSLGKQKLQAIQPILSELSGVMDENGTPDISKLLHTEAELSAMGVAPGGIAPMLGMLGPQNEVGLIPYGQLSQEDQAFYERTHPGVAPPGPLDPVRKVVHKYSRQTMSIEPQSQTLNFGKYGPNGEVIPIQGRSGEALPPVEGANGGPAPISSQFVPIVRNGIHYQWVDFGDHKELLPMPTSNTSQRGAGAPRAAGGGSLAPVAPATKTATPPTSGTPPAAPAPSSGNYRMKGLNPSKALDMKNAIEVGAHQLWGDPDNPALRPLASYAKLADDPAARDRIGPRSNSSSTTAARTQRPTWARPSVQ